MGEAFRRFALYQGTTFGLRQTQLDHVFKATKASPVHHGKCSDGNVSSCRPLMRLLRGSLGEAGLQVGVEMNFHGSKLIRNVVCCKRCSGSYCTPTPHRHSESGTAALEAIMEL
jgi:hypothetical protein